MDFTMRYFILACLIFTLGCTPEEPALKPLSPSEIEKYQVLKKEYDYKSLRVEQYKKEASRLENMEETYLSDFISLKGFEVFKSNSFDDGRSRLCYRGIVTNKGTEIVQELGVLFTINDSESGKELVSWETNLIDANDEFLSDNTLDTETQAAYLYLVGRKYPLKPNSSFNLEENKSCMADVVLGWDKSSVNYEIKGLKLRPQVEKYETYQLIDENFFKFKELKKRGEHHRQLDTPVGEK